MKHATDIKDVREKLFFILIFKKCWLRSTAVERRSLTGELSLSGAQPVAEGLPLMWVIRPLYVNQPGQLNLSFLWGRQMSSKLQLNDCYFS